MLAYQVNFLNVRNNVDWYQVFRLTTNGTTPLDLNGVVLKMQVRSAADNSIVLDLELGDGLLMIDAADGKFAINVDHLVMKQVAPGNYKQDLVMDRSGASQIVWEGKCRVKPGVTEL